MPTTSDSELDPELLQALGEVVVRHSGLEEALRDAIFLEAKADKVIVNVLYSGLPFRTLVEKFGAVYFEHHPSHRSQIDALCSQLQGLNDQRNTLIHSFWTTSTYSKDMMRLKESVSAKRGLSLRAETVSSVKVRELAIALGEAEDKVWEVTSDLDPSA
jgi:transposase